MESLTHDARCCIRHTLVVLLLAFVSGPSESFPIRSNYVKTPSIIGSNIVDERKYRNSIVESTVRATTKTTDFLDEQDCTSYNQNISNSTTITVSYEGQSCEINIQHNESILSALERQSIQIQSQLTSLPDMPFDCRRGNCLTCAALVKDQSVYNTKNLKILHTDDNGLSPTLSNHIQDQGYILTCSSFLEPHNEVDEATTITSSSSSSSSCLHLELGVQNELWDEIYSNRFMAPETQYVARTAIARVLRKSAERNVKEWVQSTEKMLKQQTEIE